MVWEEGKNTLNLSSRQVFRGKESDVYFHSSCKRIPLESKNARALGEPVLRFELEVQSWGLL